MCVFISQQPAGEWTSWSPLELLAGRDCSLRASWWVAEPATARASCRGESQHQRLSKKGRKRGMLFAGRVAEVLELPVTFFCKGKYSRM